MIGVETLLQMLGYYAFKENLDAEERKKFFKAMAKAYLLFNGREFLIDEFEFIARCEANYYFFKMEKWP